MLSIRAISPEEDYSMRQIPIALSALVGAFLCVLADLTQKTEASAIINMGNALGEILNVAHTEIVAICIVLVLAIALCLIFDVSNKRNAFYLGASVLALMMTLTPYKLPPGFKTTPNSVEVILQIRDSDGKPITGATVTLRSADERTILARTRLAGDSFRFYQAGGRYRLSVEMPGFQRDVRDLNLQEGSPAQLISVTLQRSSIPLFIQRIFR
jgi:hypothetical protein